MEVISTSVASINNETPRSSPIWTLHLACRWTGGLRRSGSSSEVRLRRPASLRYQGFETQSPYIPNQTARTSAICATSQVITDPTSTNPMALGLGLWQPDHAVEAEVLGVAMALAEVQPIQVTTELLVVPEVEAVLLGEEAGPQGPLLYHEAQGSIVGERPVGRSDPPPLGGEPIVDATGTCSTPMIRLIARRTLHWALSDL